MRHEHSQRNHPLPLLHPVLRDLYSLHLGQVLLRLIRTIQTRFPLLTELHQKQWR